MSKYPGLVVGVTFIKSNGERLVLNKTHIKLAETILDSNPYDSNDNFGQHLINAVWDAYSVVELIEEANGCIIWAPSIASEEPALSKIDK